MPSNPLTYHLSPSFAELACGLLCSCLPILPRLYQHISAIAPYTNRHGSDQAALADDAETRATIEKAAKTGLSKSKKGRGGGDWIHLDDKTLPSLPSRTTVDIEQRNVEEDRFDGAIEGREGVARSDDLEMGP